jgi:hypothetical protein
MENRSDPRQRILKAGTISFGGSAISCTVRNRSLGGANLEVESHAGIPDTFDLLVAGDQLRRRCHVMWRRGSRLGIAFDRGAAPRPDLRRRAFR